MIKNRKELLRPGRCTRARRLVLDALEAALKAADPKAAVKSHVKLRGRTLRIMKKEQIPLGKFDSVYVIGAGKASGHMAEALHEIMGDRITAGLVIVPAYLDARLNTGRIQLWKASHPIPSREGVRGVTKMLDLVRDMGRRDLVICLISGGGSALMPLPYGKITIEEKRALTNDLLLSGATIREINAVRKHLSGIKGGRLAELLQKPSKIVSLMVSDVVGDRFDTIASGPLVPDSTTFGDALYVLRKYGLWRPLHRNVKRVIESGLSGKIPETPAEGSKVFRNVKSFLIANNGTACQAALNYLSSRGVAASILTTSLQGEASEVGLVVSSVISNINLARRRMHDRPAAVIMGGETTVTVRGRGKGGRNQELVLSACSGIAGHANTVIASIGTDGVDGSSDAAGAIADSMTLRRAARLKLDRNRFLLNNDSNTFFRRLRDTIQTGLTGTNVNDVLILLSL
ncbi:MAG: glycerate kinase [Nitrososphaerales archaeon]